MMALFEVRRMGYKFYIQYTVLIFAGYPIAAANFPQFRQFWQFREIPAIIPFLQIHDMFEKNPWNCLQINILKNTNK